MKSGWQQPAAGEKHKPVPGSFFWAVILWPEPGLNFNVIKLSILRLKCFHDHLSLAVTTLSGSNQAQTLAPPQTSLTSFKQNSVVVWALSGLQGKNLNVDFWMIKFLWVFGGAGIWLAAGYLSPDWPSLACQSNSDTWTCPDSELLPALRPGRPYLPSREPVDANK